VLKQENKGIEGLDFSLIKTCTNKLLDICNIPKISVGIIVYNGSDYIEQVIRSIYEVVNQVIIVDGAVKGYGAVKPYSTDGTIEKIKKLKNEIDILDKIELVENGEKFYKDKIDMQNEIAKRVTGEYYVKMDADEIWKKETLLDAITYMKVNNVDVLRMPFYHFWLSFKNIAVDSNGKWSTKHPRIWKWNEKFSHKNSFNYFQDKNGAKVSAPNYNEQEFNGDKIYHFGYVRKLEILKQKLEYYRTRGIEKYFTDTVTKWKELNDPTQPTQKSDSCAKKFTGVLPDVLNEHQYLNVNDIREYND
jgi:glycosyltransferase involved in cell wall biosynthesis